MARPYSRDLRERLLQAVTSGRSVVEIASITGVSAKSLYRWREKATLGLSLEPTLPPGNARKVGPADEAALRAQVAARPDATLAEHCAQWAAEGHAVISVSAMCRTLQRLGLPLKKRR